MILIDLYNTKSDKTQVTKALTIQYNNVPYQFKTPTDLINPVLIVSNSVYNINCNYVYIEELQRYYYVTNATFLTANRMELACHVDVLMSHASDIRRLTAVLERQESVANAYIADAESMLLSYEELGCKKFDGGFSNKTKNILITAGGH